MNNSLRSRDFSSILLSCWWCWEKKLLKHHDPLLVSKISLETNDPQSDLRLLTLMMDHQTTGDISLQVTSENSSSERRITPSWTINHLKAKLEPVTGIPPSSQKLSLWIRNQQSRPIEAADEENTQLAAFPLAPYAEIHVSSSFLENCCETDWISHALRRRVVMGLFRSKQVDLLNSSWVQTSPDLSFSWDVQMAGLNKAAQFER